MYDYILRIVEGNTAVQNSPEYKCQKMSWGINVTEDYNPIEKNCQNVLFYSIPEVR